MRDVTLLSMKNKSVQNCRFVHHAKFHCIMTTLNKLFKIEFERWGGGKLEKSPGIEPVVRLSLSRVCVCVWLCVCVCVCCVCVCVWEGVGVTEEPSSSGLFFLFHPTCNFLHLNLKTTLSDCYENLHTD